MDKANTSEFVAQLHLPFQDPDSGIATPRSVLKRAGIVVFSGGSAANSLVDVFKTITHEKQRSLSYVIPISDNGGSSSELIRVFGGPGIGDVRSRLVRLIPANGDNPEIAAIRTFFNYRLPKESNAARLEWLDIVEARHSLWTSISSPKKELIRSFLNLLNLEIVKRARPSSVFDFSRASVGNMFLTGARLFSGSFESAIYLLSSICRVPENVSVLPAINTNFSHHISAGLEDGTSIAGQNAISHPSIPTAFTDGAYREPDDHDGIEDANLPGTLPTLRTKNINFSKAGEEDLPARIERIWYINPYGQEIRLNANQHVLDALDSAQCVIYSIGSLYTSIVPSLILRGVGEGIASSSIRNKILILNSSNDRETGPSSNPYTALEFIAAIAKACAESRGFSSPTNPIEFRAYVTHVIHLEGPETPKVDKKQLHDLRIESVRLYGRTENGVLKYDEKALIQALEAIIGKRDPRSERSRRNTLEQW